MLYYCDDGGVCLMKGVCFQLPVHVSEDYGMEENADLEFTFTKI